jgi:hypothetical protein
MQINLGDEADNSFLAIVFLSNLMKRGNQKKEDWYKQGKSWKNLDSSKRENKKAGMDVHDREKDQAHVDDMKVAQICAKAVFPGLLEELS